MTGGAIKPASQNRPGRKRRKLADQEQKDFLRRILGQGRIAKDALAGRLDHRPMQTDELRARRLAQWKRTIPGALGRAVLALAPGITGHTILLPHPGKHCENSFMTEDFVKTRDRQKTRKVISDLY